MPTTGGKQALGVFGWHRDICAPTADWRFDSAVTLIGLCPKPRSPKAHNCNDAITHDEILSRWFCIGSSAVKDIQLQLGALQTIYFRCSSDRFEIPNSRCSRVIGSWKQVPADCTTSYQSSTSPRQFPDLLCAKSLSDEKGTPQT